MDMFFDQLKYFAGFSMPPGLQLGIQQLFIDFHFERATITWNERDGFRLRFQFVQYFGSQTDCPGRVVSNRAICDGNLKQHTNLLIYSDG